MTQRLLLCALVLFAVGCGNRGVQNEASVKQGIIDYLSQRSDLSMSTMQVDVTSVSFRENEADATVSFRPKGATASDGAGMQMRYTLERKGSKWVVKGRGRNQAGQSPHGMGGMPPAGMGQPPAATGKPGASELPAGHPPIGARPSTGK